MSQKEDYYKTLGISKTADDATIKKAYRRLAKQYHPDTNAGNTRAEQKFKEITEAYSILSDPEKRKLYDQFGHAAFDGNSPTGQANSSGNNGFYEYHFENGNMDDIFGDIFGNFFHQKRQQGGRTFARKGADIQANLHITFEEAAFGGDKIITLTDDNGQAQSLKVHIPAGIDTGNTIRLRGKGSLGTGGGENGDLLLHITAGSKSGYERKGTDLYTTLQIPYTTAVFGGEARVQTIHGDVICKIHAGIQSGSQIRLKGKGIVSMKNPSILGDQYVTVQIQVPKYLTPEARQKLKEYEQLCHQSHHGNAA